MWIGSNVPPKMPMRSTRRECTRQACERCIATSACGAMRSYPAPVPNLLVRVWLPDRPGALGLVASQIGAIGGDIVGIDVLERSEHVAVDEFAVLLPAARADLVRLLVREIEEVDGASVEEWRLVDRFADPGR